MANPKLSTLGDAFTGAAVNTAVWNASTAGQYSLDQVNNVVAVNVGTTASTYYSLGAAGPYDATGSAIYCQITTAPNGNGGTQTILKLDAGSNNVVQAQVSSTGFVLQVETAGSWATTNLPAYDPHQHRWWRITEASGNFSFATSPDSFTWTTQATMSYSWSATAVGVYFQTGATDTEPAGQVATIAHVNTPVGGTANPNWPGIESAWAPYWNCNGGDVPLDRYVEVTPSTRGKTSIQRGRQYELDQVRSSELMAEIANKDGSLDPNNTSGPWYRHIQPYQPYRVRAQWPPTRNLLTQVIATGGDLGGYSTGTIPGGGSGIDVFSRTDSAGGQIAADATAWRGGRVFAMNVPSGTATQQTIWYTLQNAVLPGTTYTATFQVRNATASTSLTVDAVIGWYVPSGTAPAPTRSATQVLTGSTTAAWTTMTVTTTAPAGVAGMWIGLETGASVAATCTLQVDGAQLEKSSTATTWTCPGITYPMYGGYVERWPSSWAMNGTYGTVSPTAVDALSLLSQIQLKDPLTEEIQSRNPRFLYTLGDPQGATSVTDSTGQNPAAPVTSGKYGAGSLTLGNQITSASSSGTYTGSSNSVATVNNPNPATSTLGGATFISLSAAGIVGPANVSGSWSRMFAFRYTGPLPTGAGFTCLWSAFDRQRANNNPGGSQLYWQIDSGGKLGLVMSGPTNNPAAYVVTSTSVADSNWHLAIASYSHANGTLYVSVDGSGLVWGVTSAQEPTGLISDNVGGWVDPTVGNGTTWNYKGDLSFVAEFPTAFSSTDVSNLYNAWKSSCSGESTDARYNRILRYAGYTGLSSVQTGLTTSMGPASLQGQDALSALQAVIDTENGEHFVARDSTLTFRSRGARYNTLTPTLIFGENTAAGEIPYEDCQLDYDPTHLSNLVTITQASTNQTFVAQDATSQTNYFPRSLTRTVNSSSALECQDAAGYLLSRYKDALTRVQALKLHPSANPALWPTLLGLELGTRVRVMRRPPSPAPAIQIEAFVEAIQWDWDDQGDAFVTLQCSPADTTPYALFASFHTTLNGSPAAGATIITINAGSDNQNPAASQIGQNQQLVLGLGTANQETVTVLSVAGTTPGWTTATITLQAATTKSHANGDTVCEPLPSGVTDPTTWDASAKFDSVYLAY